MVSAPEAEPLTLAEGIERAFDPLEGMYPTQTKHALEARRLAGRGAAILGRDITWAELTPGKIQSLVRVLARDSEQGRERARPSTCATCCTPSPRGFGRRS
jgi:hypothetical protein